MSDIRRKKEGYAASRPHVCHGLSGRGTTRVEERRGLHWRISLRKCLPQVARHGFDIKIVPERPPWCLQLSASTPGVIRPGVSGHRAAMLSSQSCWSIKSFQTSVLFFESGCPQGGLAQVISYPATSCSVVDFPKALKVQSLQSKPRLGPRGNAAEEEGAYHCFNTRVCTTRRRVDPQ